MDIRSIRGQGRGNARTRGLAAAMAVAGLLTLAGPASASLPQGPEVRAGRIVPEVVGNTMTIRQTTQAAKVDWTSFDIGKDHAVRIEQPNREAFIVNRVTGTTRSQIDGSLTANGRVYLVNPNGVVFGEDAKVDVGGLVAAGVGLADEQMSGEGEPLLTPMRANGDIEHSGLIVVREGGVARLVGGEVNLRAGSSMRASGAEVMLDADATRQSGGSVRMAKGAAVHAFGGKVRIHSGSDLTLGHIRTHDLEIDGSDRRGIYRAKQKAYDGTRRGEVEEGGGISGITFTEDSTLAPEFEFEGLGPGRESLHPRVGFRDWLGRVEVRGGVIRDISDHAGATIQSLGDEAARRRIDLPQFEKRQVGDVTVGDPVGKTLMITQRDDYSVLDWKSFNVAEGHTVKFVQKDAQALAVNRIKDSEVSRIHGRIEANGRVFLFNPKGVLFGRTAQVDVGGLVAAGFALEDAQAADTTQPWTLESSDSEIARVVNEGEIRVAEGGVVTLASGADVVQSGVVDAPKGTVSFRHSSEVLLDSRSGAMPSDYFSADHGSMTHRGRSFVRGGTLRFWAKSHSFQGAGLMDVGEEGTLEVETYGGATLNAHIRPGARIDISGPEWGIPQDRDGDGAGEIAANRIAAWLNAGSSVRIFRDGVSDISSDVFSVEAPINALGTQGSVLTLQGREAVELKADIRLDHGDLRIEAIESGFDMNEGTGISVPNGRVSLSSFAPPGLAGLRAKFVEIETSVDTEFEAKDKNYDGGLNAEVTEVAFSGPEIKSGSNLSLLKRYRFDSAEVGEKRIVSPHFAIKGFNGDAEAPLTVNVDPESLTTASIHPSPLPVMAETSGGIGDRAIASLSNTTTITQMTPYLWLDWLSFDIAKDHSVVFKQERPDWLAVNRVTSARPTVIEGSLRADGRVYLLNPNGITFGPTAKVDVGGLVAAAMLASDDALMDGPARLTLAGIGSAEVANQGEIKIAKGGVASLAAPGVVAQSGQVTAPEGAIHLASTEQMTIDDQGKVAQAAGERREVKHSGETSANDGEVKIYGGKGDVIDGVVEAKGRGRIELAGTGRDWNLGGVIRPGASLLLSEVVSRFGQPAPGALSSELAQWLNAGTDVEIRTEEDFSVAGPIQTKPDALGRLTLSGNGAYHLFNRIEVPRLTVQMPLRVVFDARSKNFDGSTRSEVDGLSLLPIIVNANSNLSLIPSFDFDSPDPGERLVSAKVFLTGYHGDERHELRVIHDGSPEGLRRRTATIFPRVDPVPMPDPDGKPVPEPIPIPEPQPRPTPEPEPVVPTPVPEPVIPAVRPAPQPESVKPTPLPEPVVPAVEPGPQPEPVLPAATRASRAVDPGCIVDRDERQPPGRRCAERRSDGPPDRAAAVLSRGIRLNEGSTSSPKHAP